MARVARAAPDAVLQRGHQVGARDAKGWQDGRRESRRDCRGHGEREHARVRRDVGQTREVRRQQPLQGPECRQRDPDADGAARHRQQQALDHQLADQPRATGAERSPHRELAPPPGCAHQQEVGHVGAGDEQHEPDGAEEQQEHRARPANHLLEPRHDPDAVALLLRMGLPHGALDRLHVRARGLERHALLQPRDALELPLVPRVPALLVRQQRPQVRVGIGKVEAAGHHADDGVRQVVERDRAAHDRRIGAERAPPEAVAQDRDGGRTFVILFGQERTAERRRHAEGPQYAGRDRRAPERLRPVTAGEHEPPFTVDPEGVEGVVEVAPVFVLGVGQRAPVPPPRPEAVGATPRRIGLPHRDDAV